MKKILGTFLAGLLIGLLFNAAWAQKPGQLDIIYRIATQNYYLSQKILAFNEYQSQVLQKLTDDAKIKPEQIAPYKNHLQQELFQLDLKLKELNR